MQMISVNLDIERNVTHALRLCARARRRGVQILCFPECALTGFDWVRAGSVDGQRIGHPVPGPVVDRFAAAAAEHDMYLIVGTVEQAAGSSTLYNTAFVVGPQEGYLGRQRKVYSEPVFADGTEANVFATRYGTIGIFICADMRSPELSRVLALKGAQVLFQPTNYFHADVTATSDSRRRYRGKNAAQRSRAMENGLPLIMANAGRREYVNDSRIIGADGQGPEAVLARATRHEQLLVADVQLSDGGSARRLTERAPWLWQELAEAARRRPG